MLYVWIFDIIKYLLFKQNCFIFILIYNYNII